MSVRRVMGTETEYAVSVRQDPHANPVQSSFDVIAHAGDEETRHIRWDYRQEDPVHDMRGMTMPRAAARPDMLTDEPQRNITNTFAANGGRMYVDHAHPEYSAPETRDPFEAVAYDFAGDLLMRQAAQSASTERHQFEVFRNNADGKGAAWGSHENYLLRRDVDFDVVTALMLVHFATRQIYTGSGRVGLGERGERAGYQLSQRADYFHMKVGLQTTFDRPIVNTRDESHAPDEMRRLHVIVGDANRLEVPDVLKLGTTSMLLWVAEQASALDYDLTDELRSLSLLDSVAAMHTVSHDLTFDEPLALANGGSSTAWQLQVSLRGLVYEVASMVYGTDSLGEPVWPDSQTRSVMAMWQQALIDVAEVRHADDDTRMTMTAQASRLEWLLKWQLLERMRRRIAGCGASSASGCDNPQVRALELRWASLAPENEAVFAKVRSRAERVVTDERIAAAATDAPADTRAWFRAAILHRFPTELRAISWTRITTVADGAGDSWTLDMRDPTRFTKDDTERQVEEASSAAQLIRSLGGICEHS